MVNTQDFSDRLNKILDYYDISAATFADKIEVGRSSISHIISGRNKPSLDFVMKVVKNFPEVELYWLLNGKGSFPSSSATPSTGIDRSTLDTHEKVNEKIAEKILPEQTESHHNLLKHSTGKEIKKIVIFYADGSFEAFEN